MNLEAYPNPFNPGTDDPILTAGVRPCEGNNIQRPGAGGLDACR